MTRRLGTTSGIDEAVRSTWGTARLEQNAEVLLHVSESQSPIRLAPNVKSIVGREDLENNNHPDVNLVPYGGLEKGVSRVHAMLERTDDTLTITDIGSSNGTYLNGQRLVRDQPRVVRDGDEIRFGNLVTRIYFK
jgi:pSer/pThr/pTyr-binding forkhead associated (FHA) protein